MAWHRIVSSASLTEFNFALKPFMINIYFNMCSLASAFWPYLSHS